MTLPEKFEAEDSCFDGAECHQFDLEIWLLETPARTFEGAVTQLKVLKIENERGCGFDVAHGMAVENVLNVLEAAA